MKEVSRIRYTRNKTAVKNSEEKLFSSESDQVSYIC